MEAIMLRPYQREAYEAVFKEWDDGKNATLLVLPTGTGKTILFSAVTQECVRRGLRVLVLAHRGELLDQAADKLYKSTGLLCAMEKASESCLGSFLRVVVGSVQTLQSEKRLARFNGDYFDVIIIDEAHHAISESYKRILSHFSAAKVLGVTATPDRGDMRDLGEIFDSLAYEYPLTSAVRDGYLVPMKAQTIPLDIDLGKVAVQAGDFKASEVGSALEPYLEEIANEMVGYCMDRKTVVFLPLVSTSQHFCELLKERGFRACEVNGASRDRDEVLRAFDEGRYNVLCNSMLLTEGWDCPSVDCVVVLRPTKVRGLYSQMIGRGTRLHPGKEDLLILDFLWHTERHELCHPASLLSKDVAIAKRMTAAIAERGEAVDLEEALEMAERDAIAEREANLASELGAMRKRKKKLVDPLQYEMSIQDNDLANYVPTFGWQFDPPTQKQLNTIEKFGIDPTTVDDNGMASLLIDKLIKRSKAGLATPKQIRFLEGRGFVNVGMWSFEGASKMIGRIANNGWRVPNGIEVGSYKA